MKKTICAFLIILAMQLRGGESDYGNLAGNGSLVEALFGKNAEKRTPCTPEEQASNRLLLQKMLAANDAAHEPIIEIIGLLVNEESRDIPYSKAIEIETGGQSPSDFSERYGVYLIRRPLLQVKLLRFLDCIQDCRNGDANTLLTKGISIRRLRSVISSDGFNDPAYDVSPLADFVTRIYNETLADESMPHTENSAERGEQHQPDIAKNMAKQAESEQQSISERNKTDLEELQDQSSTNTQLLTNPILAIMLLFALVVIGYFVWSKRSTNPGRSSMRRNANQNKVTFWVACYGWVQCCYWAWDTIVFWASNEQSADFTLPGWLYSFTRLGVGVALIYFARQAKRRQDKVASYLLYTMWALAFKFILMMFFDGLFYHHHIAQNLGGNAHVYKPFGVAVLGAVFFYVKAQRKAIRE